MSQGLYSGVSGLALGSGLYRNVSGLWGGASGLIDGFGGGPVPALSLDFTNQSYIMNDAGYQFQDLIRFSRTTAGTFVGSDGFIQNTPISKNLLLWTEEQENATWVKNASFIQTNLLTYSQEFDNVAWTKGNATVTANTTVAPDGTTTGDTIAGVTAGAANFIRPATLPTAVATQYTFSIWVRAGTATTCSLIIRDNTAATNLAVTSQIVSGPGSVSGSPIVNVTGLSTTEWTRVAITLVSPATAGNAIQPTFYPETALSSTTAQSNIIWGAQLVQGATAGDYMVTGASTAAVQYTGPNGLLSAVKVVENTVSSRHGVNQGISSSALVYTASVYAKKGENDFLAFAPGGAGQPNTFTWFNLATGTIGTNNNTSASMLDVGNGWYRCSITFTAIAGTLTTLIEMSKANGSNIYLGDGTSGIYIYGAQLELASSATSYSRNADGQYPPRFDYDPVTLAPKGILIEEQRTNLLTYSSDFTNAAWTKQIVTISANAATAPDGTNTATLVYPTSTGAARELFRTVSVTGAYSYSVYVKPAGFSWVYIGNNDPAAAGVFFNLTGNGSVGTKAANWSGTITPVGNGWFYLTATISTGISAYFVLAPVDGDNTAIATASGTSGLYVWGAQLEAGSFATSYIPTVASTVTRAADTTLVNSSIFTSFYNQAAGTLLADVIPQVSSAQNQFIATLSDGTTLNRASIFKATSGLGGFRTTSSGTAANPSGPASAPLTGNVRHKVALSVTTGSNNVTCAVDGTLGTAATLSTMPTGINSLRIGVNEAGTADWLNGNIRAVRYYRASQTTAELQALTTL